MSKINAQQVMQVHQSSSRVLSHRLQLETKDIVPVGGQSNLLTRTGAVKRWDYQKRLLSSLRLSHSWPTAAASFFAILLGAPSVEAQSITINITDKTKVTGESGPAWLWLTGGASGYTLKSTGYDSKTNTNSYQAVPGANYSWYLLPLEEKGKPGSAQITIDQAINGFIFQVGATNSQTTQPSKFTGSGLVGGYFMLGEATTVQNTNTFDTSNVDQFSIPARWTCSPSDKCQVKVGSNKVDSLPMGNPKSGDTIPVSILEPPNYLYYRDEILKSFKTFPATVKSPDYTNLLIADSSPNPISSTSYMINPADATKPQPLSLPGGKYLNPNKNYMGGMVTAWNTLLKEHFIISGAAGGVENQISFYNYKAAASASAITASQLGLNGGQLLNASKEPSKKVTYTNIPAGSLATNASIKGFEFTQCTQQNSNDTSGCTTPGPQPIANAVLPDPYALSTQFRLQGVTSEQSSCTYPNPSGGGTSPSGVIGVVCPWSPLSPPPKGSSPTTPGQSGKDKGYVYLKPNALNRVQSGMFVTNSLGIITQVDAAATQYGAYSQVYISEINPAHNGRIKIVLASPTSPKSSTNPFDDTGYITGPGTAAENNDTIVFSNINLQTFGLSPQNQILGNAGAFAINSNDQIALCGNVTKNGCDQSTIVGNLRNQIVTALNRGATSTMPDSVSPVNFKWGDPTNWYNSEIDGEAAYNVYAAYLHNSGASLLAANQNLDSFTGAAYAFGFDENPSFNGPNFPANYPRVQVPSKIDSSIKDGATINVELTPWIKPFASGCGSNLACWSGASGDWSVATSWKDSILPAADKVVEFSKDYASSNGGSINVDGQNTTIRALDFSSGVGSFTFSGNTLTLSGIPPVNQGSRSIAIRNDSGRQQIFQNSIALSSPNPLLIHVSDNGTNSSVVLQKDLSGSGGWVKTGDGMLEFKGVNATQTGPISVRDGTLRLVNSDLSKAQSFSASGNANTEITIEGIGRLPGTSARSAIQWATLSPGWDGSELYAGTLAFASNLSLGTNAVTAFTDLSDTPGKSDLITVAGDLTFAANEPASIVATAPEDMKPGDSYTLIRYSGSRTGAFSKSFLSPDTTIVYDDATRTIRLEMGPPSPASGCIKKGSPEQGSDPTLTAFCGGQLVFNQSGTLNQNWSLFNNPGGQINRMNADGNIAILGGVISDAVPGTPGDITFDNTATSTGGFSLQGTHTYTGATFVNNNVVLSVNGNITSSSGLTMRSGGTVSGNGFLPATNLNPGATIAPGNSIGTLTAAALDLNGGTINAEIQGPQNDRINVLGNVTNFVGNSNLIPFGGGTPFPGFNYTIVSAPASVPFATASSLTLNQSQVSSALLRAGTTLVQDPLGDPRSFTVQWRPNNTAGAVSAAMQVLGNSGSNSTCLAGSLDRAFSSLATAAGGNANNSGSAIGSTGFTTGQAAAAGMQPGFVDALNSLVQITSDSQLVAAVNSLSPQPYAAFQSVGLDTLKQQRESQLAQAGQCINNGWIINGKKARNPLCAFAMAQNSTSNIRGGANLSSYNAGIFSSGFGLEYYPSRTWSIGGSYGYGTSYANNFSQAQAAISAAVNNVNLFSSVALSERWRLRGLLGYSNFNLTGSRSIAFLSGGSSLSASPNGNGFTAAIETDYAIPLTKATATTQALLKPLLGFAWGSYQQSGFSESGGPMSLKVNGNTANSFVTTAGLELSTSPIPINRSGTISLRPTLTVAYQVDALANNSANTSLSSTFSQASAVCPSCSTEGQNLGSSALNVAGGVDLQLSPTTSVYVNASYQAYSNASQFGYGGGLRMRF